MQNKLVVVSNMNLLANGARLVSEIVLRVAGNNISNQLNGKPIDRATVTGMALATFNRELCAEGASK